jgi:hypothetical protein
MPISWANNVKAYITFEVLGMIICTMKYDEVPLMFYKVTIEGIAAYAFTGYYIDKMLK